MISLDAINQYGNETYAMVLSERSGLQEDDSGSQEQYAFYYRESVFVPNESWLHNDSQRMIPSSVNPSLQTLE